MNFYIPKPTKFWVAISFIVSLIIAFYAIYYLFGVVVLGIVSIPVILFLFVIFAPSTIDEIDLKNMRIKFKP